MTVRVVIDAQSLSSVAARSGTGTYVRNLISELSLFPDIAPVALCKPDTQFGAGITRFPVTRLAHRPRVESMENAARLPLEVTRARAGGAVFHNPGYHAPFGVRRPWVQTLHDLIPLVMPDVDPALTSRWKRFGPRYTHASAVIAISQHAADEGIKRLGLHPSRVHVAYHGVDPAFVVAGEARHDEHPYLLIVSEYSARKGFAEAFAVLDELADAGLPHRLVVAGQVHDWGRAELDALHASARHPERIELRGFVDDLVALYQGATAFLMTSRYEGFGLPPLEAMACGVPVVAFANSSVTEVVGDGGVLVADGDVAAMAAAVRTLLESPAALAEQRERAVLRAGTFTWARSAAIHADVYRAVAEEAA